MVFVICFSILSFYHHLQDKGVSWMVQFYLLQGLTDLLALVPLTIPWDFVLLIYQDITYAICLKVLVPPVFMNSQFLSVGKFFARGC